MIGKPVRPGARPRASALLVIGGLALLGMTIGPAFAAAAPWAQTGGSLSVELSGITPAVPTENATLTIKGVVRNTGTTRVGRVEVGLGIGVTPLTLRSQLSGDGSGDVPRVTRTVPGSQVALEDGIDPQDYAPFRLAVPISALSLPAGPDDAGVYQLTVTARTSGPGPSGQVNTYLPWIPPALSPEPTTISWLWPIAARPSRDADDNFADETLARSLGPGGRLRGMVDAAAKAPVTWVVDPDLLESVVAMSTGYTVKTQDGTGTVAGTGQDVAADWLGRLRAAIGASNVLSLPYADVDVTALRRAGLVGDLKTAISTGAETTKTVLRRDVGTDVAWPPGDLTDRATLDALAGAGQRAVILADSALPPDQSVPYTPDGRGSLDTEAGPLDAILIDSALADVLRSGGGDQPGAGALMIQRFLAETALITLERPYDSRSLVVAAPRYWSVDPQLAAQLLETAGHTPWLRLAPLNTIRAIDPPSIARTVAEYPRAAREAELPANYLAAVKRLRTELVRFTAILAGPGPTAEAHTMARLRAESAAWRRAGGQGGVSDAGRRYLRGITTDLRELRGKVSIVPGGTVTLSSHTGTIPVTVRNELRQAVKVQVFVESGRADRLQVEQPAIVTVPAGGVAPVSVRAEAVANGLVEVKVQLRNEHGDPISASQPIKVQVTNYGTLGVVIIAGATALLFASAAVRIVRRSVARRRNRVAGVTGTAGAAPIRQAEPERVDV